MLDVVCVNRIFSLGESPFSCNSLRINMNILPIGISFLSAALLTGAVPRGYDIPTEQEIGHVFYCPEETLSENTHDTKQYAIQYLRPLLK